MFTGVPYSAVLLYCYPLSFDVVYGRYKEPLINRLKYHSYVYIRCVLIQCHLSGNEVLTDYAYLW